MNETAREYKLEKMGKTSEYEDWISLTVPWRHTPPVRRGKDFCFFNPVTSKLTVIPVALISRSMVYLPTNSPGTGERFVPILLAINGRYEVNYDESENRFDENLKYRSPDHCTRVDIFVCRQPDIKKKNND